MQDRLSARDQFPHRDWDDFHDRHEDWHDRYDDIHDRHDHWHHGHWHGDAGDWWHHMWNEHTALMAFGVTTWGINRAAYGFGYWGYENPYYTEPYPVSEEVALDYSQPIMIEQAAPSGPVTTTSGSEAAPGLSDFDRARQEFFQGDYAASLSSTNKALAQLPNDPIIHEFRALVLFAQGKYSPAAAGLHSVLAVGPGWDWTTLSSLYPDIDIYTRQFRKLETYVRQRPDATDARFVLAYHYLTTGNKDAAAKQYKILYDRTPQDQVVKELLLMTGGAEALGKTTDPDVPVRDANSPAPSDVVGTWNASSSDKTNFVMQLSGDGNFKWTYAQQGKEQEVSGVYAIDGNVLAMEPATGGVMLAELSLPKRGAMNFKLLGAPPGDPGLQFTLAR